MCADVGGVSGEMSLCLVGHVWCAQVHATCNGCGEQGHTFNNRKGSGQVN